MAAHASEVYGQNAYGAAVDAFRASLLRSTLAAHNGNRSRAAKALGIQRTYLCRLLRYHCPEIPPGQTGTPRAKVAA